ncbi:P-loop containing nucleoside triphosphate hydrolase protein [Tricladium varicosporioides]|nr:P-loop containing nucleoside triphosphate hydrolase protein [Hymenoscyphus varicosporioides]
MRAALRKSGQCAFCAFKASEWRATSIIWQDGGKRYGTFRKSSLPRKYNREERRYDREDRSVLQPGARRIGQSAYDAFGDLVAKECGAMRDMLVGADFQRAQGWGFKDPREVRMKLDEFKKSVRAATDLAARKRLVSKEDNPIFHALRQAFIRGNLPALSQQLRFLFLKSITAEAPEGTEEIQKKVADLRYPAEWYPATRAVQRKIHLHVGPTNSGKTYHALKRLEQAETGIFAGPLRLLAHEVYTRFNAKGKKCALITGEEQRIPDGLDIVMHSCTVEMVPLNSKVDVAVIDEIQMLGDEERGWAWTQAFLGVQAKEVHLCGELRTVQLIEKLCRLTGDELTIHRYERLGPLEAEKKSLGGNLHKLRKGDAIVLFSRKAIHAMKAAVEKVTGKLCAVVYGSLPPETRAAQAALFNDPNNDYDYLVASNAIGMGLNLSVRRIIFEATSKHNGTSFAPLRIPEINQIAGRAGRFKSAHSSIHQGATEVSNNDSAPALPERPPVGYVTTLDKYDLPIVTQALKTTVEPMKTAGIFPSTEIMYRFAGFFPPETPFSYILLRLVESSSISSDFHLCGLKDAIEISDAIQNHKMSLQDRLTFISAPINLRNPGTREVVGELAKYVSQQESIELPDLTSFPFEILDMDIHEYPGGSKAYLRIAETLHGSLTLYLWLSYRFAGIFRNQALAFHVKSLVEEKIDQCLAELEAFDIGRRRAMRARREKQAIKESGELPTLDMENYEVTEGAGDNTAIHKAAVDQEEGQSETNDEVENNKDEVDEEAHDSEDSPSSESYIPNLEHTKPEVRPSAGM